MTAGGPDNGWLPAPIDRTQIAYGVDARLQALLGVACGRRRPGLRQVAAFVAAWYFGANRAGEPTYDPTTGRTYDGISGDGVVNRNSGAESTIHGLLSMLALDAIPTPPAQAQALASRPCPPVCRCVEAEAAQLSSGATVVTPPSAWTGESQWSNGSYVTFPTASTATWTLPPATRPRLALPVIDVVPDADAGRTTWSANTRPLGTLNHGHGGPQGTSPTPGALLPKTLRAPVPPQATHLTTKATGDLVRVDAVLLLPLVSELRLTTPTATAILLASVDTHPRRHPVTVASSRRSVISTYDSTGALRSRFSTTAKTFAAPVTPGGFTVIL